MKFIRKMFLILLVIFIATGGYVAGSWIINGKPPAVLTTVFPCESRTVLVMGMDSGGLRSDVMMVVFINGENGDVNILSIPRDTMVKIGKRTYKINSAHAVGGPEQSVETVENLLDIKIDNYVKFSFETFRSVIDALGGVNYDVPQDMQYSDPVQDLEIDLKAGKQHLDGDKAEQLVRFRHYPMGDEDRIKVQQDFVKELIKQKLSPGTLLRIPSVINAVKKTVETDLPQSEWFSVASVIFKMNSESLATHQMPGGAKRVNGLSYYIQDKAETAELIEEIEVLGNK